MPASLPATGTVRAKLSRVSAISGSASLRGTVPGRGYINCSSYKRSVIDSPQEKSGQLSVVPSRIAPPMIRFEFDCYCCDTQVYFLEDDAVRPVRCGSCSRPIGQETS